MRLRSPPLAFVAALVAAPGFAWAGQGASALELTVAVDASGPTILAARPVAGQADPVRRGSSALEVLDAEGHVLGRASLPDPRTRSSIPAPGTEGHDHSSVTLERGLVRVRVPYDGVAPSAIRYGDRELPLPALGAPSVRRSGDPMPPPSTAVLLQDAGPAEERLDLVFVGDGYRESELDDFADDVDRMADYLLSIEPYGAYANLFNIWRVDVASEESGASHFESGQNISRDTALGCYYGCGGIDRLTCCDDDAVLSVVGDNVVGADGIMVLINDDTYGGSGGFSYATSYVGEDFGEQVAAHELGHSLIGLWDEYGYGGSGSGDGPNCTSSPSGAWDSWKGTDGVDAYPECSWSNLYRPTEETCMMRTLQDDYCPVCRQEAVLAMYARLPGLISSATPAPDPDSVVDAGGTGKGEVGIQVVTHAPPRTLSFSWQMDGREVGDKATLDVSCADLDGEVTLVVTDPTPWVRDDPDQLLTQELGPWQVRSGRCEPDEALSCQVAGGPGAAGAWLAMLLVLGQRRR